MLKIENQRTIPGTTVTAFGDDRRPELFYVLPGGPRFRTDPEGRPIFKFIKYKELRKEGDDLFGGLVTFDTSLALTPAEDQTTRAALQQELNRTYQARGQTPPTVVLSPPVYTDGSVALRIGPEKGNFVQSVNGAATPSLYGENVATFWVELTKEGATIFEAAMQGQGGFVGVLYTVKVWAMLPPITGVATWNASKFYSFVQEIDTDENFWSEDSYTESIREQLIQNDVQHVEVNITDIPGMDPTAQKQLADDIRANLNHQLEKAVERNVLKEIQAVDPDTKSLRDDDDIEDIKRTVNKTQISNVSINVTETHTIEWSLNPQGTVPNITTLTGPDGPIKWADYSQELNLDDAFFRTLEVSLFVNADFADMPIFSVEAKLTYPFGDTKVEEFVFKSADDVAKFRALLVDNNKTYKYAYTVNYKNSSQVFQSPEIETDDTKLTIGVDALGIWVVDIAPGDINFKQVKQAQVAVRLEEAATPIERQFTLTEAAHDFKIREVTMRPRTKPYKYRVKYFMDDGKEFDSGWQENDAPQLYINDPFAATQTYNIYAVGDLKQKIAEIMVDLTYTDAANHYTQQKSLNLTNDLASVAWSFPVISESGGELSYTATIRYQDGASREVPETKATRTTVQIGDVIADKMEVTVVPDLLDFAAIKLATVSLGYVDEVNGINVRKDIIFKTGVPATVWQVDLKNKQKTDYTWSAKYFLTDGSHRETPPVSGHDLTLLLELPAA